MTSGSKGSVYRERFYRENHNLERFRSCLIQEGESDIWMGWNFSSPGTEDEELIQESAAALLRELRNSIISYGASHPGFIEALRPFPSSPADPPIIQAMTSAAGAAGTGPMAAVAGALAEGLGRGLLRRFRFRELIIENGGDFWMKIAEPLSISVYAGLSSLSGKTALIMDPVLSPCGLACSSGTVGPSLSYGKADAAVVFARDAAVADAWATALGNRLKRREDLEPELEKLIAGIYAGEYRPLGALAIMGDAMAAAGNIRLGPAQESESI
ncbi:UPF0280 family protein [Treponema sp. OttesenSCG-928-L16]|nr:UPF0280 family protein [Treponema sp. OttesenSCG-928-L16]